MADETAKKRCSRGDKCVHPDGCWQPATREYFSRNKAKRDGLSTECKYCTHLRKKEYREAHLEQVRHNERTRAKLRYAVQRDQVLQKNRIWQINNRDRHLQNRRRRYARNHESERQRRKIKYAKDIDLSRAKAQVFAGRRSARKRNLPNLFTLSDWERALSYFNGCCAVCGRQLKDLFGSLTAAADHWIPLSDTRSDNPGTVPTNILPLCHGTNSCNLRKHTRDPIEFLETEFGKRRAREILKRIAAYFAWVREQDGGK